MTETAATTGATQLIKDWPEESREAAQLVINAHGEPDELTESLLIWHRAGQWKRIVASREFYEHRFPAPHIDAVESFIDYRVPVDKFTAIAEFDGSVVAERTVGEISARCHDEQANFLAINLVHDIVSGERDVADAREYYKKEFLDYRRKKPTPYMDGLRFTSPGGETADADKPVITAEELKRAEQEGEGAS